MSFSNNCLSKCKEAMSWTLEGSIEPQRKSELLKIERQIQYFPPISDHSAKGFMVMKPRGGY